MPAHGRSGKGFDEALYGCLADPPRAARGLRALFRGDDGDAAEDGAALLAGFLIVRYTGKDLPDARVYADPEDLFL